MLNTGDCLLIETNLDQHGYIQRHLHVILLEPQGDNRSVIIVNLETLRSAKHDQTTILEPGTHEFISSRSYIAYHRAKVISLDDLEQLVQQGIAKIRPPFNEEIYNRICSGILRSKFTPFEVREHYENQLYSQF